MNRRYVIASVFFVIISLLPLRSSAADLEVSGWLPYWATKDGIASAIKNIKTLDIVYPFTYTVQSNGNLNDLGNMSSSEWKTFMKKAKKEDVKIIPTIMSGDGAMMHDILSNSRSRKKHVSTIVKEVTKQKYDGIDIDYEAKKAETKDSFSLFLKDLDKKLKKKTLTCTVEARTPLSSLYRNPPTEIARANDYREMAKYCDQVEIMAYDQQRADIVLNDARKGIPYMPNSDVEWVEKVIQETLKEIPAKKVVLGLPTYGTVYEVTVAPEWFKSYKRVKALNQPQALEIAAQHGVTPTRNNAGEMGFAYMTPETDPLVKSYPIDPKFPSGYSVASQALAYATATGRETKIHIVSWSEANAVQQKVDLAKKYDLKGVSIFKIDGQEDSAIWSVLENASK